MFQGTLYFTYVYVISLQRSDQVPWLYEGVPTVSLRIKKLRRGKKSVSACEQKFCAGNKDSAAAIFIVL